MDEPRLYHLDAVSGYRHVPFDGTKIIVISGPSGVGKGTIIEKILGKYGNHVWLSVSATTRAKRVGEIDGVHYQFLAENDFHEKREAGAFLEHAEVHGNWYGTPKHDMQMALAAGKFVILEIDVQGVGQIRQVLPNACYLFITASTEILEARLRKRGEASANRVVRMENALTEINTLAPQLFQPHEIVPTIEIPNDEEQSKRLMADTVMLKFDNHAGMAWRKSAQVVAA